MENMGIMGLEANHLLASMTTESIKANVLFGSPGKSCSGHGICRVLPYSSLSGMPCKCRLTSALIFKLEDGKIRFRFEVEDLCARVRENVFQRGYFQVDDEFILPQFVHQALDLNYEYKILPGKYKIIKSKSSMIVKF